MRIEIQEVERVVGNSRCLFTESEVDAAINRMAGEICSMLADLDPLVLCVMNGGLVLTGKLVTQLTFPLQIEYIHATRYRNSTSGSDLQWRTYPVSELKNRNILIVDDILDEGQTLAQIKLYCEGAGANKVYSAVLIDKKHERKVEAKITADFTGLIAEDAYLYGYGMDYKGYLRNAAGIFAVAEEDL